MKVLQYAHSDVMALKREFCTVHELCILFPC